MPAEDFKGQVVTDGSLLGTAGKWRARVWSVVQLDYDEGLRPLHGMYGSVEAEFEVQRIIKRAELTAFLRFTTKDLLTGHGERKCIDPKAGASATSVFSRKLSVLPWCMSTTKELLMGHGEEEKCIDPKAGDADLWIKIWEELQLLNVKRNMEHVKAHRTEKDQKEMSHFEKADDLAKTGAMLDEGFTAEVRAKTVQQEREEVHAALQYAASFHCMVEERKDCEELRPPAERKVDFCGQEKGGNEASNGVVARKQTSIDV